MWEMPAAKSGTSYISGSFKDGSKRNYSYLYDKSMFTSLWIAYPLDPSTCTGSAKRSGTWTATPGIVSSDQINVWSSSYDVYYGNTVFSDPFSTDGHEYYGRGHQIPDADRQYNETMVNQTYYAINSTPQIQYGFNGGIWNQLEQAVRTIVTETGETIYIATGAAFQKVGETKEVTWILPAGEGSNGKRCPVPNYYWKAVLRIQFNEDGSIAKAKTIGFWFEHKPYSNSSYVNYAVSVNQLETWTGFDLFENLPSDIEDSVEGISDWNSFRNQF